ncbi:hypothetical protein IG7_03709 [Bacillus cereus HuA2-4]|nr:hypothetical protein IG7_03709 [Bacillus cereus HuA2-4]
MFFILLDFKCDTILIVIKRKVYYIKVNVIYNIVVRKGRGMLYYFCETNRSENLSFVEK